ncbi:MAG: dethiobiotin synthase [Gammaproteobacteria bacterium]|nr:dethiobiotin synthase [Gammaproteobacteria bacterium]
MSDKGIFITGTSTGVGKTHTAVVLAKSLTSHGVKVIPRKPVESGCDFENDQLIPADATALKHAASYEGLLSDVCPYRFRQCTSPRRAAFLAQQVLTTQQLADVCRTGADQGFLLVEGAGGFYSPLSEDGLNSDLARELGLPVLLVAQDVLGAINQVLLSAEAIKNNGLELRAVILNQVKGYDMPDSVSNLEELHPLLDCAVYTQPHSDNIGDNDMPADLIDLLTK